MDYEPAIVTHGGTDTPPSEADGCDEAARLGLEAIGAGRGALDAAVAAVTRLEADGRYDAGVGSLLGMDGRTIEMDAAVMDSTGVLGAVAAIQDVRHPVQVARQVAATPHVLLVGIGATRFAARLGLGGSFEPSAHARAQFRDYVEQMQRAGPSTQPGEDVGDTEGDAGRALVRQLWNYPVPWQEAVDRAGHGTVGAVARDASGRFAVAVSTGGSPPSLLGRVADTPLIGCGFYAGPQAAIACSGIGEHVVRHLLAVTVYRWIEAGVPLREALERGIDLLPPGLQIGLVGIDRVATHVAARKPMASATRAAGARG